MPRRKQAQRIRFQLDKVYKGTCEYYLLSLDDHNNWQVYYGKTEQGCKEKSCSVCSKTIEYRNLAEEFMIQFGCEPKLI